MRNNIDIKFFSQVIFVVLFIWQNALSQTTPVKSIDPAVTLAKQVSAQQAPQSSGEALPLFGRNIFTNVQDSKEVFSTGVSIAPENYWLGPGDQLGVYLLGKSQKNFEVVVNVEGKIFIPTVGVLYVNRMSISEFQNFLTDELSKYYDNTAVEVMLIAPKTIPIVVVGDVQNPGKYYLTSINTVLDAVVAAGGPTERGSPRNIKVYREGKLISIIDLYQFLMKGEVENDMYLMPNDKIVVPLIDEVVTIKGEIKRPARFELKYTKDERLSDIIELAGGFTDLSYLDKIEISRLMNNGDRSVQYINYRDIINNDSSAVNLVLENNDQIQVFSIMEQTYQKYVYIHGEVKSPGEYPFEENLRLLDLILKAGNLTRSAYLLECEVAKIDPKMPTKYIKVALEKVMSDTADDGNIFIEEDDHVFIREIPEWEVGPTVELQGKFEFPGIYAITEDTTTLSEIIAKAGGFTDEALIREASLIRKSSRITIDKEYLRLSQIPRDQLSESEYQYLVMKENTQDIGRIVVDFYKLMVLGDKSEDVTLKDGDIIAVPKKPNVVYVTGRVSRSGGVLFKEKEKIRYYIEKAGGVTWDAKKRGIKVTKVTGEIIDDEDVKSLEPGDIIWVPRKPDRDWWQIFRQTIAVVAQVATVYIVVDRAIMNN